MAEIKIENATKRFGKFVAVDDVSITIEDQEFVVLLGPSGCGKTTLLRAIAGLGMVDEGRICIGGRDVTYLPARERKISMVFQSYAIFPHMNVFDNIAFGLKMNRFDKLEIDRRVREAAELLHIEDMLDRFPSAMSGGQRQRVAVARAIAMKSEVLLMDEPLSNLDALLRLEMRAELKRLLQEIKATTLYVTHDQIEALSMGDRIAVMRRGKIQQYDRPGNVYDKPVNRFVGRFIGNPPMNFLSAQVDDGEAIINLPGEKITFTPPDHLQEAIHRSEIRQVSLGIRSENIEALVQPKEGALPGTVLVVEPLGSHNLLTVQVGEERLKVNTHADDPFTPGQEIWLRLIPEKVRWLDAASGLAIQ